MSVRSPWCGLSLAGVALTAVLPSQSWLSSSPALAPTARRFHAMAFDEMRGRTLLFGGWDGAAVLADTWAFDGATWTALGTAPAPSPRRYHAMVYDRARSRMVLFGGAGTALALGDTWEHDGTSWAQVFPPSSPSPRFLPGLAYDVARRKTVLFGGREDPGTVVADTWEYDGTNWTQVVTPTTPLARSGHTLVHDAARARTVLFGGHDNVPGLGSYLGDTWEYDGTNWSPVAVGGPAPRGSHAAVFDAPSGRTLLHGGRGQPVIGGHGGGSSTPIYSDTWAFNGVWTQISAGSPPAARYAHGMSSGGTSTNAVLFGGGLGVTGIENGDTWRLLPAAAPTWTRYGVGCAGVGSTPQLDRSGPLPALGGTFTLQLTALPAAPGLTVLAFATEFAQWNGVPLPASLDPLRPQCQLWIDPFTNWVLLHGGTTATATVAIPANPAVAGVVLGAQALSFEISAPGFALSNAGLMRVN